MVARLSIARSIRSIAISIQSMTSSVFSSSESEELLDELLEEELVLAVEAVAVVEGLTPLPEPPVNAVPVRKDVPLLRPLTILPYLKICSVWSALNIMSFGSWWKNSAASSPMVNHLPLRQLCFARFATPDRASPLMFSHEFRLYLLPI